MRTAPVIVAALLLASPVSAQSSGSARPAGKLTNSGKLLPLKGPVADYACAAYGPGFVRIDGTNTCIHVGGAVSIGVGGSVGTAR
ncbi:hypothetical protein [Bradyrhizobium sp.]|uniref:hypothetical protein n=1 Tax=Bradyrhizobium sp. TaxID=376 RepID=UPI003C4724DE